MAYPGEFATSGRKTQNNTTVHPARAAQSSLDPSEMCVVGGGCARALECLA